MDEIGKIEIKKWIKIVEDEINVKSDRALIIVMISILDNQLEMILKEFMITDKKTDEKIFNNNAPLSNFSSKISMCYYLGLISNYEYRMLENLRKIRNIFAHEIYIKKFEDSQKVTDLCNNIDIPENMYIPINKRNDIKEFKSFSLTDKIIYVFKNLTVYLAFRTIDAYEDKRKKHRDISCEELFEFAIKKVKEQAEERYKHSILMKDLLAKKLKETDNEEARAEIEDKIKEMQEFIDEYNKGNIFYGLKSIN